MLSLGRMIGRTCGRLNRRGFLRVGALGSLGLTLGDLLAIRAAGGRVESFPSQGRDRALALGRP